VLPRVELALSGETFAAVYRISGSEEEAHARALDICVEQTVECPSDLLPEGDVREQLVGRIASFRELDAHHFEAVIHYAVEVTGWELPQLLNVAFGNSSMKAGIRLQRLELSPSLLSVFKGPRFGREGLRTLLRVPQRPLLCTALKPLGLPAAELANLAYQFALGGIDVVKDDHGLADQPFARYEERVQQCAAAVLRANRETGGRSIYAANLVVPADQLVERALFARRAGVGGLMVSPGLVGWDAMRQLAEDDRIAQPILSHPALQGSFVTHPDGGISHYALFGQIARLAGADAAIYPNYGGRFPFSEEDCRAIVEGTAVRMGPIKPIFPVPGGGMSLERLPDMLDFYGREVILLIGGDLHRHGPDLVATCRRFRCLVEDGGRGRSR
jgi:ribulose-bisphosphate carboxylase large chain